MRRPSLLLGLVALSSWLVAAQGVPSQVAIPGVIAADARVELVRAGFQALEGPTLTLDGGLYFSDVDANRSYKLAADGAITVWREDGP